MRFRTYVCDSCGSAFMAQPQSNIRCEICASHRVRRVRRRKIKVMI